MSDFLNAYKKHVDNIYSGQVKHIKLCRKARPDGQFALCAYLETSKKENSLVDFLLKIDVTITNVPLISCCLKHKEYTITRQFEAQRVTRTKALKPVDIHVVDKLHCPFPKNFERLSSQNAQFIFLNESLSVDVSSVIEAIYYLLHDFSQHIHENRLAFNKDANPHKNNFFKLALNCCFQFALKNLFDSRVLDIQTEQLNQLLIDILLSEWHQDVIYLEESVLYRLQEISCARLTDGFNALFGHVQEPQNSGGFLLLYLGFILLTHKLGSKNENFMKCRWVLPFYHGTDAPLAHEDIKSGFGKILFENGIADLPRNPKIGN